MFTGEAILDGKALDRCVLNASWPFHRPYASPRPYEDGHSVLWLSRLLPYSPIISMGGLAQARDPQSYMRVGAYALVPVPQ